MALVMGDMERIETNCSLGDSDGDSTPVRVWATSKGRWGQHTKHIKQCATYKGQVTHPRSHRPGILIAPTPISHPSIPRGQLHTALDAACSALRTYSLAFGYPYMLPKLDLVGIPSFSAGAMENWGLITFRWERYGVDPAVWT